ncbi:tyrosine-protein phosphatase [Streptomyces sp. NPDC051567]|uniref:tyrosine-protein phosphatase n=1 Tax=Streptomyces sp. NPDC051567 TaxID=3365660 RepID=UPI003798F261
MAQQIPPAPPNLPTPEPDPELTGVRNFRDLGGLPTTDGREVGPGLLFRSGHLAHATETGTAFLSSLGLHTVFDFRNHTDHAVEGPDIALPGVRNVNIPLSDPADAGDFWRTVHEGGVEQLRPLLGEGRAAARMSNSYRTMVERRTAEHGRVLRALAEDSVPALMHCAAGKDRAGLSVAVTLLALGVERGAVMADYLESNAPHRRYRLRRGGEPVGARDPEVKALLAPLFDARTEYLAAAFEAVDGRWGGVGNYLAEGLGLTPGTLGRLRDRLLR